jgi:secreted Zn-dependent insulinase-like peptidase
MENQTHPLIVLPSGLTLLVVERPNSKAFAATMTLPVGTNHSPFEHPQLAHLVEHLAFLVGNRQET